MGHLIEVRDLLVGFPVGDKVMVVLDHVGFHVDRGEWVGLVGLNGSGKTTLFHVLMGVSPSGREPFVRGEILFNGKPLHEIPLHKRTTCMQIVLQNPHTQLTQGNIARELTFPAENQGTPKKQGIQQIATLLNQFQYNLPLKRKTQTLSSGEKQITNLLASQVTNPQVLLLDEPTAFLDKKNTKLFLKYLKQAKTKNKTILIATHFLEQYLPLLDKLLVIQEKHITQYRIPQDLTKQNMTPVLWRYLPAPVRTAIQQGKNPFTYGTSTLEFLETQQQPTKNTRKK